MELELIDRGVEEYGKVLGLQRELHQRASSSDGDFLVLCEHPHVYTLGKSGKESNLLIGEDMLKSIDASLYRVDRGGDITYHGYGQLVGYPILNLVKLGLGVRGYIEALEGAIIAVIARFGIKGERREGSTGVWLCDGVHERKICAIGVKVSRGVTMHGFALNVDTDLRYFGYINPCGFGADSVTSISKEVGDKVDMGLVKELVIGELAAHLGCFIR